MPRLKLTEVELDNAWLDELAQLEPVISEETEHAKRLTEAVEENAALQKDLGEQWKREQAFLAELAKLRAEFHQKEVAYQQQIAELRAALERTVNHGN